MTSVSCFARFSNVSQGGELTSSTVIRYLHPAVQHGTVIVRQCATLILPLAFPQTFILAALMTAASHVLLGASELAVTICPPVSETHTHIYLHFFFLIGSKLWSYLRHIPCRCRFSSQVPRVCKRKYFLRQSLSVSVYSRRQMNKKNVKLLVQFMKAYSRNGGIAPFICILRTTGRWVVRVTPPPFHSRVKRSMCPLSRRLGGPQSFFYLIEKAKWLSLLEFEPRIIHPVAYTELYFRAPPFFKMWGEKCLW